MINLSGIGSIADFAKGVIDRFWPADLDPTKKLEAQYQLQKLVEDRENNLLSTQRDVMVAEMNQGDNFTKRARPMVVYSGLLFIFLIHVVFPVVAFFTGKEMPDVSLPQEFWWAWSGTVSLWIMGRSFEKKGSSTNRLVKTITG